MERKIFRNLWNPANIISLSRIPLAFLIMYFFENKPLVAILLAIAIISDLVDGYVARATRPTVIGGVIDPLTDKFFFVLLVFFLLWRSIIQSWHLPFLFIREVYLAVVYTWLAFHPQRHLFKRLAKARLFGKLATAFQFSALVWFLFLFPYSGLMVLAVGAVSLAAMIEYSLFIRLTLKKKKTQ